MLNDGLPYFAVPEAGRAAANPGDSAADSWDETADCAEHLAEPGEKSWVALVEVALVVTHWFLRLIICEWIAACRAVNPGNKGSGAGASAASSAPGVGTSPFMVARLSREIRPSADLTWSSRLAKSFSTALKARTRSSEGFYLWRATIRATDATTTSIPSAIP